MENIQEITQEEGADIRKKTNPAAIVVSLLSVIPTILADTGEAANKLLWYYLEKTYQYKITVSFFEAHPKLDAINSLMFNSTFLGYFITSALFSRACCLFHCSFVQKADEKRPLFFKKQPIYGNNFHNNFYFV